jgi:membrane protease YdiL (CAAX protease family)
MTVRDVFINQKFQLRAGWRIAIFMVALTLLSIPFGLTFPLVVKIFGEKTFLTDAIVKLLLTAVSVIASYVMLHFLDKRQFAALGMNLRKGAWRELFWGMLIGFAILTMAVGTMAIMGYEDLHLADESSDYFAIGFLTNIFLFIIVGFNEEILFRGYIFQSMIEGTNKIVAVVFFSLLFGAAHLANPNATLFGAANIVLAGILLSLGYLQTKSLWLPIGLHIGWNFTQGYIWGLPVSGTSVFKPLIIAKATGPEVITGGAFGPEGGAACTVVCTLACIFIWKYFKPTEEMEAVVHEAVTTMPFKPKEIPDNSNGTQLS